MVDVEMQNIEIIEAAIDLIEHHDMIRCHIPDQGIETEGRFRTLHQLRGGNRIAARKQCHVVTQPHQLLGKIGDDTLGAAVKLGWTAFCQRRNLSDFHLFPAQFP